MTPQTPQGAALSDADLKPCPFCDGLPTFERVGTPRQSCIVVCESCGARHESSDEGKWNGQSWNTRAADRRLTAEQPVAWEGAEEWEPLAWELCANECGEDACNELIWEGGAVPEPWGERWLKYEDEAKRLIAMVRKYAPAPVTAEQGGADDGRQQSLWVHDLGGPTETIHDKREAFGENDEWTEFRRAALTTQPQAEPMTWREAVLKHITDPARAAQILSIPDNATGEEARAILATPTAQPQAAEPAECSATGWGHRFGPNGPGKSVQCEYCGTPTTPTEPT